MATIKIINPVNSKKPVSRLSVQNQQPAINPTQVLNWLQYSRLLVGTHDAVFTGLVKRFLQNFHGTKTEWDERLKNLKDAKV